MRNNEPFLVVFSTIRYILRGQPDAGFALFESESLKWPGFVEFDDVNGKVLTYSAQDRLFFWPSLPKFCDYKFLRLSFIAVCAVCTRFLI